MKPNRLWISLLAVVLFGACLLGIALALTSGLIAWQFSASRRPAPSSAGVTVIAATPVRPILGTPDLQPTATTAGGETFEASTPPPQTPSTAPGGQEGVLTLEPAASATRLPQPEDSSCIPINQPSTPAVVLRVIDGITIEVDAGGQVYTVRYLGLELPDYAQDATIWARATARNTELVGGKQVLLVEDRRDQDEFGRRLRYVLAGGVFVNLEMARSGYAIAAESQSEAACSALLLAGELQAVGARLGAWAAAPTATRLLIPSPTPTVSIVGTMTLTALSRRGTLWQEPEEWVELRNDSQEPIQLEGWTLHDDQRHIFVFPSFVLGPGQYCRVYTNEYHPASCGFSYWSPSPIWDNVTECAYLKNPYDELVSQFCYGFQ